MTNALAVQTPELIEFDRMMERLKLLIANGKKLSDPEAQALARFAVVEKLDPFSGECYLLKNEAKGEILGPMVGIKGLRRKAQERLGPDENYFLEFVILAPPNPGIQHAVECRLRDTKSMRQYLEMRKMAEEMMRASGSQTPSDDAAKMVGPAPVWVGVGYFYGSEANEYKDKKYHPLDKAKKRAEATALKQRFSLNYTYGDNGDSGKVVESADENAPAPAIGNGNVIEGQFASVGYGPEEPAGQPGLFSEPATMTLEQAQAVLTPSGKNRLGTLDAEQLDTLKKMIGNNCAKSNREPTATEQEILDAIRVIKESSN